MEYIGLEDDTVLMLTQLQKEWKLKDLDETLKKLLLESKKSAKSMRGAFSGMPDFKRDDQIDRFA
ncbi:MAG: hypothetical protein Q7S65_02525 [Nanoarchaeota archaeon]|nr:hypothetical protein [Nanoarchaeota archaeon]